MNQLNLKNLIIDLNQMRQRYHSYLLTLKNLMFLKMLKIHLKPMFLKMRMYQKMPNFLKNPTYHFDHLNHKNLMNQLNLKLKLIHNIRYLEHQRPGIFLNLMLS
jgi:hypothetical protein